MPHEQQALEYLGPGFILRGRLTVITVGAVHIAPVKSLALVNPTTVRVDFRGILEDRRLYLVNHEGRLLTQREIGPLVQIKAEYQAEPERLRLRLPDGSTLEGPLDLGDPVLTLVWGRLVRGRVVKGDWSRALSAFCQQPVTLVRSDEPGQCFDEYPISMMSQASVERLGQQPGATATFDSRRFRPNFLLSGCVAHEEDSWLGGVAQVGEELRVRVVARDPRCAITTHDPDTGERDCDTLRLIMSYRPSPRAAYLGVYGIVERPGTVSIGDAVTVVKQAPTQRIGGSRIHLP